MLTPNTKPKQTGYENNQQIKKTDKTSKMTEATFVNDNARRLIEELGEYVEAPWDVIGSLISAVPIFAKLFVTNLSHTMTS